MTSSPKPKPLPIPNQDTQPFWDGCARGELRLQLCSACKKYRHPPSPICPDCLASDHEWLAASGKGSVYSFVVVHQAPNAAFAAEVPYVVAIVQLAEGPHIFSNIIGTPLDQVEMGMAVQVCFERLSDEVTLPKFRRSEAPD